LLVMLVAYTAASALVFSGPELRTRLMELPPVILYLSNWARAFGQWAPFYLGHSWSLSIEEQYYLMWPVLMHFLFKRPMLVAAGVALAIAAACAAWRFHLTLQGLPFDRLYNGTDTRLDGLLMGSALALYLAHSKSQSDAGDRPALAQRFAPAVAWVAIAAMQWMFLTQNYRLAFTYTWGIVLANVLSVALVWALVAAPKALLARLLSFGPLAFVGTVSYGLYLWHWPIYRFMFHFEWTSAAILAVGGTASLALAWWSHRYVEQPILDRVAR
jgi:peptidoglycan/LPS O-acetylase OafA/YrhL